MKKLLFLFSILLAAPAFTQDNTSKLEAEVAALRKQTDLTKNIGKIALGAGLLGLAGGAFLISRNQARKAVFFAALGNATVEQMMKTALLAGLPSLAVAATSGFFGGKLFLGGTFGLLKSPLEPKQETK